MKTDIEDLLQVIQSPKIRAIVEKSAATYINLMANQETELLEAMQEVDEGKPFSIAHSLTLHLEKNKQIDKVAFSVKHSIEAEAEIPNPEQPDLPMDDAQETADAIAAAMSGEGDE